MDVSDWGTLAAVAIAGLSLWQSRKANKLSKEAIRRTDDLEAADLHITDMRADDRVTYVTVRNAGRTRARNMQLQWSEFAAQKLEAFTIGDSLLPSGDLLADKETLVFTTPLPMVQIAHLDNFIRGEELVLTWTTATGEKRESRTKFDVPLSLPGQQPSM